MGEGGGRGEGRTSPGLRVEGTFEGGRKEGRRGGVGYEYGVECGERGLMRFFFWLLRMWGVGGSVMIGTSVIITVTMMIGRYG